MEDGFLTLHTTLAPEALKQKLQRWEPWRHRFDFDNGVSTRDCAKRTPFNERPLGKFALFAPGVPFAELAGGRLLDVGSNVGHNSIHAAVKYRFSTIGIDINSRHIEVSRFLAGVAGASCEFELGSAETFSRPREFDVILHFGTLYHLPNPLLSLRQSFENLKPELNDALERLAMLDSRKADVVKLRYFGGLKQGEIADVLKISTITVRRDWVFAKAWLYSELRSAASRE
jgi:RNA polymerase sigma factor (sigma-70 family)